jgi:hypothetical protein
MIPPDYGAPQEEASEPWRSSSRPVLPPTATAVAEAALAITLALG